MAKTKDDYFQAGKADAMAGKRRAALAAGNWQAAWYDKGYDAAARELRPDVTLRVPTEVAQAVQADEAGAIAALQKRPFVNAAGGFQVPRAVLKHCNQLQAVAQQSDDPARAARCARKIEKIMTKWGKRAHAHQLRAGL